MRAPRQVIGSRSGPGAGGPSGDGRRSEGPLFRRGALSRATRDSISMRFSGWIPSWRMYHGLDEPALDTLHFHVNDAEFSVGDFELNYRMHHRAGRAIKAVLEGAVDESVRNEAAFRLARIHFQKAQLDDALHALARIEGPCPREIRDDVEFLRANIYMATGRPGEAVEGARAAAQRREPGRASPPTTSASRCCRTAGRRRRSSSWTKPGSWRPAMPRGLAIRDKSNLVLGTLLFESANFDGPKQSLDRVRLEGPFSNQALLRAGWAEATAETVRPGARPLEHPGRSRADGHGGAGSHARRAACVRQPERARPRRADVRARARAVQHPDRPESTRRSAASRRVGSSRR